MHYSETFAEKCIFYCFAALCNCYTFCITPCHRTLFFSHTQTNTQFGTTHDSRWLVCPPTFGSVCEYVRNRYIKYKQPKSAWCVCSHRISLFSAASLLFYNNFFHSDYRKHFFTRFRVELYSNSRDMILILIYVGDIARAMASSFSFSYRRGIVRRLLFTVAVANFQNAKSNQCIKHFWHVELIVAQK